MITLAFYKSKKHIFNRLVSWWTGGPYSHVELVRQVPGSEAWYECWSSSTRDGGVRGKLMGLPADTWDVYHVSGDEEAALSWFKEHEGKKYDLLGLFGFLGKRGVQDQNKWFCSEAVAASLYLPEPWRYDPNGLHALVLAAHGNS